MNPNKAKWLNFFVCIAASVVIIGALFKLQHWRGADIALILGLSVEALIFFVYAFVPDSSAQHAPAEVAYEVTRQFQDWTRCCRKQTSLRPTCNA